MEKKDKLVSLIVKEDGTLLLDGNIITYDLSVESTKVIMFCKASAPEGYIVISPEVFERFSTVHITGMVTVYENKEQMEEKLKEKGLL